MGIVVGAREPIRIFPHPVVTETALRLQGLLTGFVNASRMSPAARHSWPDGTIWLSR